MKKYKQISSESLSSIVKYLNENKIDKDDIIYFNWTNGSFIVVYYG